MCYLSSASLNACGYPEHINKYLLWFDLATTHPEGILLNPLPCGCMLILVSHSKSLTHCRLLFALAEFHAGWISQK